MVRSPSTETSSPDPSSIAPPAAGEMKFEAALADLEEIVQLMEGGRLPLEESISAYRRGSELLRHCQNMLGEAERKIQVLEDDSLNDFDTAGGDR